MYPHLRVFMCVSVSLYVCLCVCVCPIRVSLCVPVIVILCLCVSLRATVCHYVYLRLCASTYVSVSLGVSL